MAKKKIDVSVIIVNFNTPKLTRQCVDSVIKNTKKSSYEIYVVDNASSDNSLEILSKYEKGKKIKLIKSKKNLGFSGGNNLAMKKANGEYLLLLNSDTKINTDVISEMVNWMNNNRKVGISTCKLRGIDGVVQPPGGNLPNLLRVASWMTIEDLPFISNIISPFHPKNIPSDTPCSLGWVSGTFFLIRNSVVKKVGYMDEAYFMYTEEVDYCYRAAQHQWERWYVPTWEILHYGKASSSSEFALVNEFKGIKTFFKKHYAPWQFPVLRSFLKLGSALRIIAFSVLGKNDVAKIYVKTYQTS